MDRKTRDAIDLDLVLEHLAARATSSLGRDYIAALAPTTDVDEISRRARPIAELMALHARNAPIPLGGLFDAGDILRRAAVEGTSLDQDQWPRLIVFLDVCARVAAYRDQHSEEVPTLASRLAVLEPNEELQRRIESTFDRNGGVRDDASRELHAIRRSLRANEQGLLKLVTRLAGQLHERGVLQENFSTVRNGRHVFPVRSGSRGKLPGIMHGSSSSGETVFVEPLEVVEASNEIEELRDREAREVHRILLALTKLLQPWIPAAQANLDVLRWLDGANALARVASEKGWSFPRVDPGSPLRLFKAHHPLLHLQDSKSSVPVTMLLDRGDRCLVFSGPNAGGKTTAMKMLALHSILAQCGAPIPAFSDSTLPVFDTVLADIGDSQDLEQGLSTFSGHLRRIREIIEQATDSSLILMDELGTGTDPQEGGAIALALLESLSRRAALTLTTSHLNPVKQWADSTPHVRNASFSLDPATHVPTFRLRLDIPGASEALHTAEREGLPADVLERARALAGSDQLRMGDLLRRIEERERELANATRDAEARVRSLEQQEALARARAEMLHVERLEQRERSLVERERAVTELREKVERLIAELPGEEELRQRKLRLGEARENLDSRQRDINAEAASLRRLAASPKHRLPPGKKVYVRKLGQWGEVVLADEATGRARVVVGMTEVSLRIDELLEEDPRAKKQELRAVTDDIKAEVTGKQQRRRKAGRSVRDALRNASEGTLFKSGPARFPLSGGRVSESVDRPTSITLDLHGFRVEEALAAVDRFLDRSLLSSFPYVKLCHGTGTGRLYKAIHEYLRTHPAVKSFRFAPPDEGGGGTTIVEL